MASLAAIADNWRQAPTLVGRHVRLEPMTLQHLDELRDAVAQAGTAGAWYANVPTSATLDEHVAAALHARDEGRVLPFIVRATSGEVVGSTRFYDLDPAIPKLSIGYTWYVTSARRTGVNTETKLLLLGHAFEVLRCHRVAFETSRFNQASRTALAGIGAREEGLLRNHKRHADGSLRDTVVFSIIDGEWPTVRQHLRARLARHDVSASAEGGQP